VDREHRRCGGERSRARDERDQKCGVPVVGVNDVRWRVAKILEHRAAEERVALRVVRLAVDAIAAESLVVANEHHADLEFRAVDGSVQWQVQRDVVTEGR